MTKPSRPPGPLSRAHEDFGVRAGFLVHDVSRLRRVFFDDAMRPHGLTRSQWWVLGQLSRHGGRSMSQVDLAKHLDIGRAALGALIDRLEAAGYVARSTIPDDRRVNLITITPKGLKVTGVMRRIGHALNLSIFEGLTDAQVNALEEMLARVKGNLLRQLPRSDVTSRPGAPSAEPAASTGQAVPKAKTRPTTSTQRREAREEEQAS